MGSINLLKIAEDLIQSDQAVAGAGNMWAGYTYLASAVGTARDMDGTDGMGGWLVAVRRMNFRVKAWTVI